MKLLLILSALVVVTLGEGFFKVAYRPLGLTILTENELTVAGGKNATRNQLPYQVSIQRIISGSAYSHFCGGSIMSQNWILTAAHCTSSYTADMLKVVAGILLLTDSNVGEQIVNVQQIINHPDYPGGDVVSPNDISLVQLASPLTYTVGIQPIAIPTSGEVTRGVGILSGWGLTSDTSSPNNLQFANLPIVPEDECNQYWSYIPDNPFSIDLNLCSGTDQGYESACSGDSGGPYVKDGVVIGVVSWGSPSCGTSKAPSVYAKTSAYTNWITNNTNGEVKP